MFGWNDLAKHQIDKGREGHFVADEKKAVVGHIFSYIVFISTSGMLRSSDIYIYIYIYMCVCVCVCVCPRKYYNT